MHDPNATTSGNDDRSAHQDGLETDVLIGRIIDGEARAEDRRRFDALAGTDTRLWRQLALRQQDMAELRSTVEQEFVNADRIDLPADAGVSVRAGQPRRGAFSMLVAYSGWAAVLVLTAIWSFNATSSSRSGDMNRGGNGGAQPATNNSGLHFDALTPDDHLREYLRAPFVKGEMAPTLLHIEPLPDGRQELHILRRIEETVTIGPNDKPPVDEHNNLTKPPAELRGKAPNQNPD